MERWHLVQRPYDEVFDLPVAFRSYFILVSLASVNSCELVLLAVM